jgi:hypothetical protein
VSEREQVGGVAWEAREAMKAIRHARDAGDDEAEYAAWIRYAEALTNASYSGAAQAFIGILNQRETDLATLLQQLAGERKEETQAILKFLKELQGGQTDLWNGFQKVGETLSDLDARHAEQWGQVIQDLDQVRAWVEESRAHRQQLQAQIDTIQATMLPEAERDRLIAEHNEDRARFADFERRLTELEREVQALRRSEAP